MCIVCVCVCVCVYCRRTCWSRDDVARCVMGALWSRRWRRRRRYHLVLLGLDAAGKSTALFQLRFGEYVSTTPTVGFNCERVRIDGAAFDLWDVGGQDKVRLFCSYG